MTTVRCSALPLAKMCPASVLAGDGPVIDDAGEPAFTGNAVHDCLANHARGELFDPDAIAAAHGGDPDEVHWMAHVGRKVYDGLAARFDTSKAVEIEVQTEMELPSITLTGKADVRWIGEHTATVLDYKTGRLDSDYEEQLIGYAALATSDHPHIEEATIITAYLRQGFIDSKTYSVDQVKAWVNQLDERLGNQEQPRFNPGGHCAHCKNRLGCEARTAMVRSTLADLTAEGVPMIEWTPETRRELGPRIGDIYNRVKAIEGLCDQFRQMLRDDVEAHGPLPIGDGRQLYLSPMKRRTLDAGLAVKVLERYVDPTELLAATKISLSQCEEAAAKRAGRGMGAKTKERLNQELEQAGALLVTESHSLREGKVKDE